MFDITAHDEANATTRRGDVTREEEGRSSDDWRTRVGGFSILYTTTHGCADIHTQTHTTTHSGNVGALARVWVLLAPWKRATHSSGPAVFRASARSSSSEFQESRTARLLMTISLSGKHDETHKHTQNDRSQTQTRHETHDDDDDDTSDTRFSTLSSEGGCSTGIQTHPTTVQKQLTERQ